MKKLLMAGAILVMGAMVYGQIAKGQANSADVTVKAEIISNGIIISDLDNGPIVLDFKKVSNQLTSGISTANEWYKVTLIGGAAEGVTGIKMQLGDTEGVSTKVTLKHSNPETADTNNGKIIANVGLDKYEATLASVDFDDVDGNKVYVGNIDGALKHGSTAGKDVTSNTQTGHYMGYTTLTVKTVPAE